MKDKETESGPPVCQKCKQEYHMAEFDAEPKCGQRETAMTDALETRLFTTLTCISTPAIREALNFARKLEVALRLSPCACRRNKNDEIYIVCERCQVLRTAGGINE